MSLLEVRGLTKTYPPQTTAVDHVSLAIAQGDIVCLLGPSGCGKTTLLRLIAGLEYPDSGEVWFDGRDVAQIPPHLRDFGMMFQDFALFPHKNVYDNVAFGLEMHGLPQPQIAQRVAEMLALVDLVGYDARDIAQLSGGEQQRVALARALAPGPRLLMLDEPLGALDRALRERLMLELRAILKRVGVTAVYVTHDQTEAFAIADRIAVMNKGQIEQIAAPQTVYGRPATPFVARFLGLFNVLGGTAVGTDMVETAIGRLVCTDRLPVAGTPVTLLVRPEAASALPDEEAGAENIIAGTLTAVSFRGRYYQIWLESQGVELMFEMADAPGRIDDTVCLTLDPQKLTVLAPSLVEDSLQP
jgi:ABC-type Fe3+/spermidine/putrescine transport system ATPase subunit